MDIITDIIDFLKSLALVDVIFFFAVLVLMLLIIAMIYFVRENSYIEEDIKNSQSQNKDNFKKDDKLTKEEIEANYLKEVTEALEAATPSSDPINFSKYEEEQEEKAIISYEELLKHKDDFALNYSEEENIDDELTIKKVDLDNLINKDVKVKPELNVMVISYEKEEAFLEALRTLQQKLN